MIKRILQNIQKDIQKAIEKLEGTNNITIKNLSVLEEIQKHPWHPTLLLLINWVVNTFVQDEIVITSGFRKGEGIHGTNPLRAIDLRSRSFENPKAAAKIINTHWDYGKEGFKICLYHRLVECIYCGHRFDVDPDIGLLPHMCCSECGSTRLKDLGPHFHLQVRHETQKV